MGKEADDEIKRIVMEIFEGESEPRWEERPIGEGSGTSLGKRSD
jgi:hypothetical protein